jgi:hypothetical protein
LSWVSQGRFWCFLSWKLKIFLRDVYFDCWMLILFNWMFYLVLKSS